MTPLSKLFVVYDPTRKDQPALERAAEIAAARSAGLHIFTCAYADTSKATNRTEAVSRMLAEQRDVLDEEASRLSGSGVQITTEVEWDQNWYNAVVRASIKHGADLVLKSSYKHSAGTRMFNQTSDWTLIRQCLCPVLLVKESASWENPRILAAIDICARTESYGRLNQYVIDVSKNATTRHCADLHVVNAFQDFKGVPDREEIIRSCGIDSDKVHIKLGKPEKVIVEHAKKLDASMVVLGNSGRTGLSGALMGNTVEKVLDKLECDVLSMR
jgi:universal stress protein E